MFFKYLVVSFLAIVAANCAALISVSPLSQIQRRQNPQCDSIQDAPIACFREVFTATMSNCSELLKDLSNDRRRAATEGFVGHGDCIISWDPAPLTRTLTYEDLIEPLQVMFEDPTCNLRIDDRPAAVHIPKFQFLNFGDCTTICLSNNKFACLPVGRV